MKIGGCRLQIRLSIAGCRLDCRLPIELSDCRLTSALARTATAVPLLIATALAASKSLASATAAPSAMRTTTEALATVAVVAVVAAAEVTVAASGRLADREVGRLPLELQSFDARQLGTNERP